MFRHEDKYLCSQARIVLLKTRLHGLLGLDAHAGQNEQYTVRSLYFDDRQDSCYFENEDGTDLREKYRIRTYNQNSGDIRLELKQKRQGLAQKQSCAITKEQCLCLISGKRPPLDDPSPPLLRKLCLLIETRRFRPVVVVEYSRTPFVCRAGNVRITFDRDITSSNYTSGFLEGAIPRRPIMAPGQHIMEVKWDHFLPDYIRKTLQTDALSKIAYSKYYFCRRFSLTGRDTHGLF